MELIRPEHADQAEPATEELRFGDDFDWVSVNPDCPDVEQDSTLQVLGGGPHEWGSYDYVTFSIYGDNDVKVPHDQVRAFLADVAAVAGVPIAFSDGT